MADWGILSGIAKGLNQGVDSYVEGTRYQDEQARKRKEDALSDALKNIQIKNSGYNFDPESNQVNLTPEGEASQRLKTAQTNSDLASYDPNSEKSRASLGLVQKLINKISPDKNGDSLLPPRMSEADLNSKQGLLEKYLSAAATQSTRNESLSNNKNKQILGAYEKVEADPDVKKAKGALSEINNITNLVDDAVTNPASANAIGVFMARFASGGSRINRQEIEALGGGAKDISDKLKQIATTGTKGTITPENAAFAKKFINVIGSSTKANLDNARKDRINAYSNLFGVPAEELAQKFGYAQNDQADQKKGFLQSNSQFPMTVRKGSKMATVNDANELKEANAEGFQ